MFLYSVYKSLYCKDLTAEGAAKCGRRLNLSSFPCVYTSESRALALLEYTVNNNIDFTPNKLCFAVYKVDKSFILDFPIENLPSNSQQFPAPAKTKDFGSKQFINK